MAENNPGLLETIVTETMFETVGVIVETLKKAYGTGSEFSEKFQQYLGNMFEQGIITAEQKLTLYDKYQARQEELDGPPKRYIQPENGTVQLGKRKTAEQIRKDMRRTEDTQKMLNGKR